jgi:dolichol kinase
MVVLFVSPPLPSPQTHTLTVLKLSLYSGVLALGVGDSIAALCGKLFGKTKWPGKWTI